MKYIIYCRKSSEAEDRQILSIESQYSELIKIAERDQLEIIDVFKESMSAKSPGRPLFNEMIKKIEKLNGVGIITWKMDRLARNAMDGGIISWYMDRNLITEIRTFGRTYKNTSEDKFMMGLDFNVAKKYVDDLSVNVKRGLRTKLEKGEWPGPAPTGYLNNKATKTIVIDKRISKYIKRLFELYATGGYTTRQLANKLYEEGLRSSNGNKITKSTIHNILNNPFYYGMMVKNNVYYPGKHEPLITKNLFDKAQSVLQGKLHPKAQKHSFPLRGFMKCGKCGCMLTATIKKGHIYYYCTNGKKCCEEHKKYLRSETINQMVANIFNKISFDEKIIEIMYEAAKQKLQNKNEYISSSLESLQDEFKSTQDKQNRLLDTFISGLIPEDTYKIKMQDLNNKITELKQQTKNIEKSSPSSTLEQTKNVFLSASRAKKEYLKANNDGKRRLVENLLWNLTIESQKMASFQLKMPYQLLVNKAKNNDFSTMLRGLDSNQDRQIQNLQSYH